MESIEQRKSGMDKFKWYDFLGALILLFSVTKSAIKPPEVTDYENPLFVPSASTTLNMDSIKVTPRKAVLSQVDMLNPSINGNNIGDSTLPDIQEERMNVLDKDVSNVGSDVVAKTVSKAAPQVQTRQDQKGEILVSLRSLGSSHVPVFIC